MTSSPTSLRSAPERPEDRFLKVFRSSPEAIILRTLDGGRVIDVNDRYLEIVGFSREELLGRNVFDIGLWADPEEGRRILDRLRREGALRNIDGRFRHKSGAIRDVLISAELTEIGGEAVVIGMLIDITERKLMETELRRSRERLRSLGTRLQQIREEERIRIARELHDELGGFLTVLKLDLSSVARELGGTAPGLQQRLEAAAQTIVSAIGSVRRICSDLRPSILDNIGLTAAIEWQVHEWQSKTGIRCRMEAEVVDESVGAERATAAFRILQEALTNVARHARASQVRVRLWTESGQLRLSIGDDGFGVSEETVTESTSLGLLGMKERVFPFGGAVEIRGGAGSGTTVDVSIPLRDSAAA